MKSALALLAIAGLAVVGCARKSSNPSVTDISSPPSAYEPAPHPPVAAQPVIYDTPQTSGANNNTAMGGSAMAAGGAYTIRKGDTLYSIAKARYGDGKQWQKIASANPGVSPSTLKVGQTITVP